MLPTASCKRCTSFKPISPLILGNDLDSMATEPMIIMWNTDFLGDEKWAGKKRDEDYAHLDAFVVAIVCFLRVQIHKADLRETKREGDYTSVKQLLIPIFPTNIVIVMWFIVALLFSLSLKHIVHDQGYLIYHIPITCIALFHYTILFCLSVLLCCIVGGACDLRFSSS